MTDAMAHAWCETFDSETGWQVREHTLPYQEAAGRLEEEETAVPREDEPSVPREDELGDTLDEQDNESQNNEEMGSDEPDDENRSNAVENTDGEDTKGGSGSGDGAEGQNGFRSSVVIKTTGTAAGILVLLFICVLSVSYTHLTLPTN